MSAYTLAAFPDSDLYAVTSDDYVIAEIAKRPGGKGWKVLRWPDEGLPEEAWRLFPSDGVAWLRSHHKLIGDVLELAR